MTDSPSASSTALQRGAGGVAGIVFGAVLRRRRPAVSAALSGDIEAFDIASAAEGEGPVPGL